MILFNTDKRLPKLLIRDAIYETIIAVFETPVVEEIERNTTLFDLSIFASILILKFLPLALSPFNLAKNSRNDSSDDFRFISK